MPKQSGIYQIKGKFEQRSYYRPKNMSTGVFRSINQQMSERVKTEPSYANTRKYAGEFGCATSWGNQVASYLNTQAPISNLGKKRTDIAHSASGMIRQDTTHEFGRRSLRVDGWQDTMMAMLNQMPRVSFDANYGGTYKFYSLPSPSTSTSSYDVVSSISEIPGIDQRLSELGANSLVFDIYVCRWEAGYFSTLLGQYYPTELVTEHITRISSADLPVSQRNASNILLDGSYPAFWFVKTLVVATPYKRVGNQSYPLTHLRSFKFFDLPYGESRIASVEYKGVTYRPGARAFELNVGTYPTLDATMSLESGTTIENPTAKINGVTCTATKLSNTQIRVQMSNLLDGDTMRILAITSGSKTYTFVTNS